MACHAHATIKAQHLKLSSLSHTLTSKPDATLHMIHHHSLPPQSEIKTSHCVGTAAAFSSCCFLRSLLEACLRGGLGLALKLVPFSHSFSPPDLHRFALHFQSSVGTSRVHIAHLVKGS